MAKTDRREEKFRCVMVRIPIARSIELDEASQEIGLAPANYACMQVLKVLNARKGIVPADEQASIVNH
jgi:hypothetical protein